jgi:hypothetical protein
MPDSLRARKFQWLIVLCLVGFGVYWLSLTIPFYQYVYDGPRDFFSLLHTERPSPGFFRPIENLFLNVVQAYFGLNTLPMHVTQVALHVLLSWLVYIFMIRYGFSMWQAVLGSLFMLVSQANVSAVIATDTLSQVAGTLFGCLSLLFLWSASFTRRDSAGARADRSAGGGYVASAVAFAVCLFWKESGICFLPALLWILLVRNLRGRSLRGSISRSLLGILPFLAVLILYLAVRTLAGSAQPTFGPGRYEFNLGANIVKNLFFLFISMTTLVSTVRGFMALTTHDVPVIIGVAVSSVVVVACLGYGLLRSKQRPVLLTLVMFAVIAVLPVVLLNNVNEVYAYNSMPFVSVVAGAALTGLAPVYRARPGRWALWAGFVVLVLACNVIATESKILDASKTSGRATAVIDALVEHSRTLPKDGTIVLVDESGERTEYWRYVPRGLDVFWTRTARWIIAKRTGRDDINLQRTSKEGLAGVEADCGTDCVILVFDGERLSVHRRQ